MFLQGEAEGKGFLGLHLHQAYSHCERHCASVTHENKHFKAQKFNEINIFIDYQCKQLHCSGFLTEILNLLLHYTLSHSKN